MPKNTRVFSLSESRKTWHFKPKMVSLLIPSKPSLLPRMNYRTLGCTKRNYHSSFLTLSNDFLGRQGNSLGNDLEKVVKGRQLIYESTPSLSIQRTSLKFPFFFNRFRKENITKDSLSPVLLLGNHASLTRSFQDGK